MFDIFTWLTPCLLIFLGLMVKLSKNDAWSTYKKSWIYFILVGVVLLVVEMLGI